MQTYHSCRSCGLPTISHNFDCSSTNGEGKKFYFAYGSCMSLEDMHRTEPRAKVVGTGRLYGMRLAFTRYGYSRGGGVADIVPSTPDDYVEGIIYEVPNFTEIDKREGHPTVYKRSIVFVRKPCGNLIVCNTYAVVRKTPYNWKPSDEYRDLIIDGASVLSEEYRDKLTAAINNATRMAVLSPDNDEDVRFIDYDPDLELRKRMEGI